MKWLNSTRLNQYFLAKLHLKYHIFNGPDYWQSSALKIWWSIWKLTTLPMWMTGSRALEYHDLDEPVDDWESGMLGESLEHARVASKETHNAVNKALKGE